mgnify:CR=1 FL=1
MSELKVVEFKPLPLVSHDQTEVIRKLEEALALARKDDFTSVALILVARHGDIRDGWHDGGRPYVMVGAIESLKADYLNACIERR